MHRFWPSGQALPRTLNSVSVFNARNGCCIAEAPHARPRLNPLKQALHGGGGDGRNAHQGSGIFISWTC